MKKVLSILIIVLFSITIYAQTKTFKSILLTDNLTVGGDILSDAKYNSRIGTDAGGDNTTGYDNTFLGLESGKYNTTSHGNLFAGEGSGGYNTIGNSNIFLGSSAGGSNTGCIANVTITSGGATYLAGSLVVDNTGTGGSSFAGTYTVDGSGTINGIVVTNNGYGYTTVPSITPSDAGDGNAVLTSASIVSGDANIGIGQSAYGGKYGDYNISIGGASLQDNISGDDNIAIGTYALGDNILNDYSIGIGGSAGFHNKADKNLYLGYMSGYYQSTGTHNTIIGMEAGKGTSTNIYADNTLLGFQAGYVLTTGGTNTFIGSQSGLAMITGTGNVFIGYLSGSQETSSDKLYIENSNSTSPLIYGEFDNNYLKINGEFETTDSTKIWTPQKTSMDSLYGKGDNGVLSSIATSGIIYGAGNIGSAVMEYDTLFVNFISNGIATEGLITVTLADDGSFNLASGRSGLGVIQLGDGEEYAWFSFTSAGVVTLITNSANVTTTLTTNDKLNIGDGGTYVTVENTFTASKQVTLRVTYNL